MRRGAAAFLRTRWVLDALLEQTERLLQPPCSDAVAVRSMLRLWCSILGQPAGARQALTARAAPGEGTPHVRERPLRRVAHRQASVCAGLVHVLLQILGLRLPDAATAAALEALSLISGAGEGRALLTRHGSSLDALLAVAAQHLGSKEAGSLAPAVLLDLAPDAEVRTVWSCTPWAHHHKEENSVLRWAPCFLGAVCLCR